MKIPDGVDWHALPDDHWEEDDDGYSQQDHRDDEVFVGGLGKYSDVEAEDGHLDKVDFHAIEYFGKIIFKVNQWSAQFECFLKDALTPDE